MCEISECIVGVTYLSPWWSTVHSPRGRAEQRAPEWPLSPTGAEGFAVPAASSLSRTSLCCLYRSKLQTRGGGFYKHLIRISCKKFVNAILLLLVIREYLGFRACSVVALWTSSFPPGINGLGIRKPHVRWSVPHPQIFVNAIKMSFPGNGFTVEDFIQEANDIQFCILS